MGLFNLMASDNVDSDFYVDLIFSIVFLITIIVLIYSSCKIFKHEQNRDYYSILTIVFVMLTLVCNYLTLTN